MTPSENKALPVSVAPAARLMSVKALAGYLGLSYSAARELVICGVLPRVALPSPQDDKRENDRPTKRILVDRLDVDALISKSRETIR